jgi:hypothetical protein
MRERHAWIAVTAVLATSMAWLAAVNTALLVGAYAGQLSDWVVVMRALLRVALHAGRPGGPVALAALVVAALTLAAALPRRARAGRSVQNG